MNIQQPLPQHPCLLCSLINIFYLCRNLVLLEYLAFLLRNLYADQEATVRTRYRTMNLFQIRKGVQQSCLLSSCLFNVYAEYIIQNAGLDESHTGIRIARRNINNLKYVDTNTLVAEREEELKSFLMRVKNKSEKAGLKLSIKKIRSWHPFPSLHGK